MSADTDPQAAASAPSPAAVEERIRSYFAAVSSSDAAAVAACFAADATLEDPVGSDQRRGIDAIREFFGGLAGTRSTVELKELLVAGNRAAFNFVITTDTGDNLVMVDVLDVMTFDEEARITSMRAFWTPEHLGMQPKDV